MKIKLKITTLPAAAILTAGVMLMAETASAFDMKVGGFIRQEMSYNIGSKENPW